MAVQVKIPEKFEFLFKPKRIKVAFGGRGGGKTNAFTKVALLRAGMYGHRFLCLREFMNSIDDSVHSALSQEIYDLDLDSEFHIKNNGIDGINGSGFRYAQLARNIASLKSKHNFDVAWIEEAETVTEKSLDFLIPTIRKENSEIWISFNPDDETGAVYSRFVKPYLKEINRNGYYEDDMLYVVKVCLEDNPFAPKELIDDSMRMKKENYKKWLHIYGGECFADYEDSIIQPAWVESAVDAHIKLNIRSMGIRSLGFDPADSGDDDKAVVLRQGFLVEFTDSWGDGELPHAIDKAFDYANELDANVLVYDADGLGAGVKVGLDQRLEGRRLIVEAYKGGSGVDDPDSEYISGNEIDPGITNKNSFRNKRAQYWWYLRDRFEATHNAIENGIYTDPNKLISLSSKINDFPQLKSELIKVQRKRTNNSLIQIESKVDMKKRGYASPNLADALVLSFANKPPLIQTRSRRGRRRAGAMAV